MKKIVICSIPMKENVESTVYISNDQSLPASGEKYRYPINSFLSQTLSAEDDIKFLLLIKKDTNSFYEKNTENFKQEIKSICDKTGAKSSFVLIDTDFSEDKAVHEELMSRIVDQIDVDVHILADITYGPKDLPIVIFTALNFAEKFLNCEVDNIIYGQAEFQGNKVTGTAICDMIPLYCLSTVTNSIKCDDPNRARQLLKSLLSL